MYEHLISNKGNASKDYTLINPPLGAGAFGEVRKAVHKASGVERAIKIIYKAKAGASEL
jgi:calcium-dependent protein kinase